MRPDRVLALLFIGLAVAVVALSVRSEYLSQQEAVRIAALDRSRAAESAAVAREEAAALAATTAQRDQAQAKVGELTQALQTTSADRDQLKASVDKLQGQVTALQAVNSGVGSGPTNPLPVGGAASGPNHFAYGYCTWYVANRRPVPWFGNAGAWLAGAAAYGYPIGSTPRPGAIMVTSESRIGHVAYVESVGSSSFTVSEMNYAGWNVVDWRQVAMGSWFIRGFVYG